jgi:hypothetical protein
MGTASWGYFETGNAIRALRPAREQQTFTSTGGFRPEPLIKSCALGSKLILINGAAFRDAMRGTGLTRRERAAEHGGLTTVMRVEILFLLYVRRIAQNSRSDLNRQ